jgi:hypothetical protein
MVRCSVRAQGEGTALRQRVEAAPETKRYWPWHRTLGTSRRDAGESAESACPQVSGALFGHAVHGRPLHDLGLATVITSSTHPLNMVTDLAASSFDANKTVPKPRDWPSGLVATLSLDKANLVATHSARMTTPAGRKKSLRSCHWVVEENWECQRICISVTATHILHEHNAVHEGVGRPKVLGVAPQTIEHWRDWELGSTRHWPVGCLEVRRKSWLGSNGRSDAPTAQCLVRQLV